MGNDPKSVVKSAKQLKRDYKKEQLDYDSVWVVFDRDEHPMFEQAIDEAKANKIHLALSVPCFEIWLLLHFRNQTAHIEREDTVKTLKNDFIQNYEKNMTGIFEKLKSNQVEATNRAQSLRAMHESNYESKYKNPSTTVDELVSFINEM